MFVIGVDPHKGSHTATVLDTDERALGELRVRDRHQRQRLMAWAEAFSPRTRAIEGATGTGALLAQQLVAAGETVLDVPPTLSARARLLDSGSTDKTDPHDARSAAVVALRHRKLRPARTMSRSCACWPSATTTSPPSAPRPFAGSTRVVPAPGGWGAETAQRQAGGGGAAPHPRRRRRGGGAQAPGRRAARRRAPHRRGPGGGQGPDRLGRGGVGDPLTELYGVGSIVAAYVIGYTGDVFRFPSAGHYARYNATAPIEASSGPKKRHRLNPRGNRQLNHAIYMIAVTQVRNDTPGRAYYLRKQAEGKSRKEAMRALKRRISDSVYRQLVLDALS